MRSAGLAVAGVIAVFGGRWGLLVVAVVLSLLATGELLRLVRATGVRPEAVISLAGTVALLVLAHLRGERGPRLAPAVIAAVLGLTFAAVLARKDRADVSRVIATTLLPVLTVGLLAAFLVALRNMPEGFRLTLVLVAMVLGAEALPALALAMRGRTGKVGGAQRLIAGQIGAFAAVAVAGLTFPQTFSWPTLVALGAVIGLAAPVGRQAAAMVESDLMASATVGPEAKGAPAPALLVRIDGLLLAAPIFFYVFRALSR